uniref:Uncharacterized protein n=1 Tax=Triticum urartu TaxID=4572 RepID=A0A8R7Q3L1_TRIUA
LLYPTPKEIDKKKHVCILNVLANLVLRLSIEGDHEIFSCSFIMFIWGLKS